MSLYYDLLSLGLTEDQAVEILAALKMMRVSISPERSAMKYLNDYFKSWLPSLTFKKLAWIVGRSMGMTKKEVCLLVPGPTTRSYRDGKGDRCVTSRRK